MENWTFRAQVKENTEKHTFKKKHLPWHCKFLIVTALWRQNSFRNCNTFISFCLHLLAKWEKLGNALPEQFLLPASVSLPQSLLASVWSGEVPCSKHLLCLQPRIRNAGVNWMLPVPIQMYWYVHLRNIADSVSSIAFSCPLMAHLTYFLYEIPIISLCFNNCAKGPYAQMASNHWYYVLIQTMLYRIFLLGTILI